MTTPVPGSFDFQVRSTELIFESPILGLRRDVVTMPGGGKATREIVEHFGAVAVVALNDAGELALVRQYRHSVAKRLVELPAGLLDIAGEDELSAAQRELLEEAGLHAQSWEVLVDMVASPGFCDEAVRVFLARDLAVAEAPQAHEEEADMVLEWVPLEEAQRRVLRGEIVNSIAIAGILSAAFALSSGHSLREPSAPFEVRPHALAHRRCEFGAGSDMKNLESPSA